MNPVGHLGGGDAVTGSCHLLTLEGCSILIDCGLAMGHDETVPMDEWSVKPCDIDWLFTTHAHIDHIGRIPELLQKGFHGEIIASHPTKALLTPMLRDAMGFSGIGETERKRLVKKIDDFSWGFEYGESFELKNGVEFELHRAGHILGSSFIRFTTGDVSVIFSGDLGARNSPILPDPDAPPPCDLLFLESTYGDRLHSDRRERIRRLGGVLSQAVSDGGKIVIPAFALGRTQELIYEMDRLFSDPELRKEFPQLTPEERIPVCIDSPLGINLTEIYSKLSPFWDREARNLLRRGDHPIDFDNLYTVRRHKDHLKLVTMPGPCIIIAGSGMCTGGRVVNHLKACMEDPSNHVIFAGYQAAGTPGRRIAECASGGNRGGGRRVELDGASLEVRAHVHVMKGYSAHADQKGLVEWVNSAEERPGEIRPVHGSHAARCALADALGREGYRVRV